MIFIPFKISCVAKPSEMCSLFKSTKKEKKRKKRTSLVSILHKLNDRERVVWKFELKLRIRFQVQFLLHEFSRYFTRQILEFPMSCRNSWPPSRPNAFPTRTRFSQFSRASACRFLSLFFFKSVLPRRCRMFFAFFTTH